MEGRPQVRARSAQDWLTFLSEQEPQGYPRVLEAIPQEERDYILSAAKTEWIDVKVDRYVPKATLDVLGDARATALWGAFIGKHVETPLFSGLVRAMVRLFGLKPGTFARLLPRAWKQTFRNCCEVELVATGDNSAHVAFTQMHEEVVSWEPYCISWRAVIMGVFKMTGHTGDIEMKVDVEQRRIDMYWSW